ncbi:hypothetical protein [Tsukamurella hominis]|uniref:hypothetical protein n=1 Tax=Tsukamurella hominis TaxID=1970232 RepID=UPI0039EC9E3C
MTDRANRHNPKMQDEGKEQTMSDHDSHRAPRGGVDGYSLLMNAMLAPGVTDAIVNSESVTTLPPPACSLDPLSESALRELNAAQRETIMANSGEPGGDRAAVVRRQTALAARLEEWQTAGLGVVLDDAAADELSKALAEEVGGRWRRDTTTVPATDGAEVEFSIKGSWWRGDVHAPTGYLSVGVADVGFLAAELSLWQANRLREQLAHGSSAALAPVEMFMNVDDEPTVFRVYFSRALPAGRTLDVQ